MSSDPITREQRDALIAEHETLWAEYVSGVEEETLDADEERELQERLEVLLGAYFDGLPRLTLSRCPFCKQAYRHSFDPWGVDGYWWQEEGTKHTPEPEPCPHFGVLQGAVNLNGLPPHGSERLEAYVGPGAPFVIPRLFEADSVVAVVSTVRMENGYSAYPIAYFTSRELPPGSFTHSWTRASYTFQRATGDFAWRIDSDPWDFDLEPWVEADRLVWIEPGDAEARLHAQRQGPCPYVGLAGIRERQYITGDTLSTRPPPAGEDFDPFSE